ncbi:MAG: hypothetical protein A2Y76_11205 [Planctomycetes bacterium RBG_13_60_9]|nr:MAG: hypothetical protein A2Y76_11205 [Planctomycetes bacterium RBG_13_60_9]
MGVTIHVNGTANSLVHKGSMGIAMSTLPDVCKTPSPAGPVPIPYPVIVSRSADLTKGTKTVKVDGKKMAAVKGSEFSRCMGDEPGTAGGVVSSTNMKEATWLLYSFDVKLDGKNACRLADKMMMNHKNTACLAGELQVPVTGVPVPIQDIATRCHEKVEKEVAEGKKTKSGKKPSCTTKGIWKHKCCKDEIENKGYSNVKCEDKCGTTDCRLDVAVGVPIPPPVNVQRIYDYKFNCGGKPKMSKTQRDKNDDQFPNAAVTLVGP